MEYAKRLYEERKYKRALLEFLKEEVAEDQYHELAYYLGLCYTRLKEYDEALLYLEQVISSSPSQLRIHQCRFIVGYIHTKQQNYILAEHEFLKLFEEDKKDQRLYSCIGHCLLKQGKLEEAKNIVAQGLEMAPKNPQILNTMAYVLTESANGDKDTLRQALVYGKRALDKSPNETAYLDTVGWTYYRMGEYQEAIMFLGRANNADPDNVEVREHLKIVYEKSNTSV